MTNNPRKLDQLERLGVAISERVPHVIEANDYNEGYLATKAAKSGHLLNGETAERLLEQDDRPIVSAAVR